MRREPASTAGRRDDEAAAVALCGLPGIGPVSLGRLLSEAGGPAAAWEAVRSGNLGRPGNPRPGIVPWAVAAARIDPWTRWEAAVAGGIGVTWVGRPDYPSRLALDPLPPPVLFWRGHLEVLDRRCVAVIGTRRCTPGGRRLAWELGRDLAEAGMCVVSGLALGIDGHAHLGACTAGPRGATVGVAASGVDVPYPRRHAALWQRVVERGAVISETAPGGPAQRWRFPARNRVIAGSSELVVVVESHSGGGSLLTVEAALERGIEVRAVPGPVHSSASEGTNQLLFEGAGPVRSAADVLDAMGEVRATGRRRPPPSPPPERPASPPGDPARGSRDRSAQRGSGPPPAGQPRSSRRDAVGPAGQGEDPRAARVLAAVGWEPTSLNRVVARVGLPIAVVVAVLEQLAALGSVAEERGWWQRLR